MKQKNPKTEKIAQTAQTDPLITAIELQQQGKLAEAEALFRRILQVAPTNVATLYSLSLILLNSGRHEEALKIATVGTDANPDVDMLWFIRGATLQALHRRDDALASYDQALVANSQYVEVLLNSGVMLHDMHRHHEALERFRRILDIDPEHEGALGNYGILLTEFKQGPQAVAAFERLLRKNPDYPYGLGLLCYERMHLCDWIDFETTARQITAGIRDGRQVCKTLAYMAISDVAKDHLLCAQIFAKHQHPGRPAPLWQGECYRHTRIRIAYVSPDLREHPVGHLMVGVIETHDKSRFETIGISLGIDDGSRIRARMIAAFDHFIDAKDMHPRQIAELMRQMEVDIAVDLAGYTSDARTEIFLNRPAPIQANYLGYPGTMGIDCHDYIIADRTVIPEDHQIYYTEKVAYLDHCYLPIASGIEIAEPLPRSAYGLPDQGFVFCAFSHDYKIHPEMFAIWMRLLKANSGSVLWLVSRNEVSQKNLRQAAQNHGIDPDRLVFAARVPKVEDHLARYRVADLFLDTWPYNAHTTAADALLAGLPVVTYRGNSFPSRVAGSLLHTVGLQELIAHSLEDYEILALNLAINYSLLADVKAGLIAKQASHIQFDTKVFCRDLEAAYIAMRGQTEGEETLIAEAEKTKSLDLGCGPQPKKPFNTNEVFGIDVREVLGTQIRQTDLAKVAVLVPIYKDKMDPLERYSLDHSLAVLAGRDIFFIGSKGLDRQYYSNHYSTIPFLAFDVSYFETIAGYNRLLLSSAFYKRFITYNFVLILQTDAIVVRDDLDFWCEQPFDYVGAPWPDGYELFVNAGRFEGDNGKRVRVTVGNGGLSLRRIRKCLSLLEEFPEIVGVFDRTGSSEDLFFSIMGALSGNFIIPNEITASGFSMELKPSYYYAVNGNKLPMGGHAWCKWEPEFWRGHLVDMPLLPLQV